MRGQKSRACEGFHPRSIAEGARKGAKAEIRILKCPMRGRKVEFERKFAPEIEK